MDAGLTLWGYYVPANILLTWIALYVVVSITLIILIPILAVPIDRKVDGDGKLIPIPPDDLSKIIDMRSKIRSSIMQTLGGLAVFGTVITSIQGIRGTEDAFNQKKAELFATNVKPLLAADATEAARAEAIHVLSFVARSDRSYHRAVFDALASYVKAASDRLCTGRKHLEAGFKLDGALQLAMRSIGERRIQDDPTGKHFDLEHGCYADLDLQDEWGVVKGLGHTRMAASKMHRAKFVKAEMQGTEFMGIEAGDYQNPGWCTEIGNRLHEPARGDTRPARCTGTSNGEERRHFVAHFIDANLTGADFTYANIQGADFSGATLTGASFNNATISRVSFKGVTGLKPEQLENACVGAPGMSPEQLECEQPYFTEDMQAELKKNRSIANGIRQCGLKPDGTFPSGTKYSPIACSLPLSR
ncbi:pentapeptide repeat-containing protein [Bradyrhizobium sp. Mp27]|uniref:pentapeptide repeat-containing protein n=1 Tax=Bradyrhizobium sp. Mp27 TaxID=3042157 RepID=UPI00248CED83|nr:pentapeptide repeat-containing protein [Bradyrhizobium sp. Mp27]MDI2076630.1 pentapeptide repeat-containing protein [Bradyrhizobium sp. Mp27]